MMLLLSMILAMQPTKVTYAAGYIPNVQFAPFYLAMSKGYYKEAGIDLKLDYTMGSNILKLVALNKMQIGSVDPDAFLHAAVQGLPVVHISTLYQSYPIAIIAKEPITTKNLKGKRIGVSGTYGASYLGLKAILNELELKLKDVNVSAIGYTQVGALKQGQVDAVVGYVNNEPIRLSAAGMEVHLRTLSHGKSFPGVGLMTSQQFMKKHPELVKGFLDATYRGMKDVLENPRVAYELIVKEYLPELSKEPAYSAEYRVLEATLPFWNSAWTKIHGLGQCDPDAWQRLANQIAKEQQSNKYDSWEKWVKFDYTYQE